MINEDKMIGVIFAIVLFIAMFYPTPHIRVLASLIAFSMGICGGIVYLWIFWNGKEKSK